jgi:hypothetical protein
MYVNMGGIYSNTPPTHHIYVPNRSMKPSNRNPMTNPRTKPNRHHPTRASSYNLLQNYLTKRIRTTPLITSQNVFNQHTPAQYAVKAPSHCARTILEESPTGNTCTAMYSRRASPMSLHNEKHPHPRYTRQQVKASGRISNEVSNTPAHNYK